MSVCPDLSESSKNVSNFHEDPLDTEKKTRQLSTIVSLKEGGL